MKSRALGRFWRLYEALPSEILKQARESFRIFSADPFHPGLCFKELRRYRGRWSARIGNHYRAVARRDGDTVT